MRRVVHGLGVLIVFCVALRILAWLVTPALPILLELFAAALILWFFAPFARR